MTAIVDGCDIVGNADNACPPLSGLTHFLFLSERQGHMRSGHDRPRHGQVAMPRRGMPRRARPSQFATDIAIRSSITVKMQGAGVKRR